MSKKYERKDWTGDTYWIDENLCDLLISGFVCGFAEMLIMHLLNSII